MPDLNDAQAFVMSFVNASRDFKSQFHEMWQEVTANFVVDPQTATNPSTTSNPYRNQRSLSQGVVLKDQETHKAIMAWAANLVQTVIGDPRGEYIRAMPSGWEDALGKAQTSTKLMRYAFTMDGVFRSMVEATIESLLFGTCVLEVPWRNRVVNMPQRTVNFVDGVEFDSFSYGPVTAYDDPEILVIDTQDAFPDPSEYRLDRMSGFVKRFRVNVFKARQSGVYDQDAVERAIESTHRFISRPASEQDTHSLDENFREGYDQPYDMKNRGEFTQLVGFEYWGEVPWSYSNPQEPDPIQSMTGGQDRGVVTCLMGEIVRNRAFPYADVDLPFRSLTVVPTVGRFYGISLGEVMRYDQDILDALKVLLVEAVFRKVHPPIAYDENSEIDEERLRTWSADVPIPVQGGPGGIATLRYDADVFSGIGLGQQFRESAQSSVAATEALQGLPGPSREPATAAALRFQQALSRPGLTAALWEKDELPRIAKSIFRRYQQFLPDTEALMARVGQLPQPVWIGDIMGDFDFKFMGSRLAGTRQEKLQAFDRLTALAAAIPQAGLLVPWLQFLPEFFGDVLDLPEIAARIGDPQQVLLNMGLQRQGGPGAGNGNREVPGSEPAGTLPAQAVGGLLG